MADELKPCPFCGAANAERKGSTYSRFGYYFACPNDKCCIGPEARTELAARDAWNERINVRRSPDPRLTEAVALLREAAEAEGDADFDHGDYVAWSERVRAFLAPPTAKEVDRG